MTAALVDCPACDGSGCAECNYCGRVTAERAAELLAEAADAREASDDDRAHAWRERMQEREDGR